MASELVRWLPNQSDVFPFEPLIATLSSLGFLIFSIIPGLEENDWGLAWVIFIIALGVLIWIMRKLKQRSIITSGLFWTVIIVFVLVNMFLFWNYDQINLRGTTIKVMLQTELDESTDNYATKTWEEEIAQQFKKDVGVKNVEIDRVKNDVNERLKQFLKHLNPDERHSSEDEVDVFAIDVIWPGIVAKYAEDLTKEFANKKFSEKFDPKIFENNKVTTSNGTKLVAVPWYIDAGLLYYRKDLLQEYFPNNDQPPETWKDLENMAKTIQDGERKRLKRDDFWGFVWQGKASEGLTCNALEWQFSHGGGKIVDTKKNGNEVDIDIDATTKAFDQAKNWINNISPPETGKFDDIDMFRIWRKHNAAFMRNWLYAYNESVTKHSGYEDLQGKVGVALLPKGDGQKASHASTLGGWQLMVNAHSQGKEKKAAIKFVEFLIDKERQKSLALKTGKVPALKELYRDGEIVRQLPFLDDDDDNPYLKNFFVSESIEKVQRPSTSTGDNYTRISEIYSDKVHYILQNNVADTQKAVISLKEKIQRVLDSSKSVDKSQ
ncbi:MAG: extracellular solute-binding protein [Scytonema sp. RU_4_4]|nr:extracellular solute-binding protein [Scytonema sp. RU_4_4]